MFGQNIKGHEKRIYPRIGAIIETPGFYPNLTGTENLEIFAKLRGTPQPNAVKNVLEVVGLPYKDKKLFSKYSLGMKQRLGIATVSYTHLDISKKRRRLAAAQKRAGELEKLICKIYEDNALGKLPDARYKALDAQYAKEQDALEIEIAELEKAVTGYEQSQKSAEKFIALIDKYENFDTLTNTMLNEFVEKILVHERADVYKRQVQYHADPLS